MQYDWGSTRVVRESRVGRAMAAGSRTSGGLAARIVRVTLIVGFTTVLMAGTVALVSVSKLASERAAARDLAALQLVDGAIDQRLSIASGVLDRASALVSTSESSTALAESVGLLYSGSRSVFDHLSVVEVSGARVLYSGPKKITRLEARASPAFLAAVRGSSGFSSSQGADGSAELWATRTAATAGGTPVVILARLDSTFLQLALERAVRDQSGRAALLLDGEALVGSSGGDTTFDVAGARWTSAGEGLGRVAIRGADGRRFTGYYSDIQRAGEISWRVIAIEPMESDVRATVTTVMPSVLVFVIGGLISAALTWYVTRRLVRPLGDLERTARIAASGSYVKPLASGTDDEIGRLAIAFNQVALRLNALHDLSQLLASTSRLDQVLDGILSAMEHIVGPGAAAIYLVDSSTSRLVPARTRGAGMASVGPVDLSVNGWLADALNGAGPVTLSGTASDLSKHLPGLSVTASAALAAPLVAGHDPLGLVVIIRDDAVDISEAELEMVRTFSAQAAVAVQTSRLFEIESESRRIAEALRAVAEQLVRPDTLATALESVEATVAELFRAQVVKIAVVDPAALGLPDESMAERKQLIHMAKAVLEGAEETVVLRRGADSSVDVLLDEYDGQDLMVVPVGLDTDHGGVLVLVLPDRPEAGSIEVAHALADELALALDNAYFYERALTRATNLETIFRISQAVASPLQVNVVLNRVLDVVQKILSADAVMLWSYDARRRALGTAMVRGDVPARMVQLELVPGEDLPGHVFQSGQPVLLRDLTVSMGGVAGSAAQQELRSLLAVPLLARGRPIGVLMVLSAQAGAFSDEDMNVLQTFASQAALSIDTARLYSRQHDVAHVLQQSILPEALPDYPEIDAGSMYAPAGGDADIGGDYYDIFRGPDQAIWLAIADVCGKGVQAATKTSMIKYAIRALVVAGLPPSRIASEVNKMTADAGDPSDIVTLWVGRYDAGKSELSWADGGHPPAVLRRSDGTYDRLGPTGPLLGAMREAIYEEGTVSFRAGDRLLLYTDGVTEARQGNMFFGEQRLEDALSADRTAQEDARLLLESVRVFVQGELRDDVAVLVVAARKRDDE